MSGQHVAVEQILCDLRRDERFDVVHLPYRFAQTMGTQGALSPTKLVEVARIGARLLRLRLAGPIDLLLYPLGGTNIGSTVRDTMVVAMARLVSRRTVVQFHGAGHATAWKGDRRLIVRLARRSLGGADAAIVHARANAIDATFVGVSKVWVAHHRIPDRFDPGLLDRDGDEVRVVYLGHMGPHRGTPQLLEAIAKVAADEPGLRLYLAGDGVGGYDEDTLAATMDRLGLNGRVERCGTVTGVAKDGLYARAHLFAFPSVFVSESFGLVLAEALMWGLPVVATDWRANREVLNGAEAVIHPAGPDLAGNIESGLREALARLDDGRWPRFSSVNRSLFEDRYRVGDDDPPVVTALAAVLAIKGGRSRREPTSLP